MKKIISQLKVYKTFIPKAVSFVGLVLLAAMLSINSFAQESVTYHANGGTGSVPVDLNSPYTVGDEVTVLGNIGEPPLSKVGFTFAGWNTQADGEGVTYQPGATFNMPATPVVLYALWASITLTGTLEPFTTTVGAPSLAQLFTFSASNLSDDVTITAPPDYEVSTDFIDYTPSISVPHTDGSITHQIVYVRIAASAPEGSPEGDVTVQSGTITETIEAEGTVNAEVNDWYFVGRSGFTFPVGAVNYKFAIDNEELYVAYQHSSASEKITVRKFNGQCWELVGAERFSQDYAVDFSLVVDNGTPYVGYRVSGSNRINVEKFNGTDWVMVGPAGFNDNNVSEVTLNVHEGTPYVAIREATDGKAIVKKYDETNWVNVGAPYFTSRDAYNLNLQMNDDGVPYLAYTSGAVNNPRKLSVMKFNGASWELVGAASFSRGSLEDTHISLVINNNTPYVSYITNFNGTRGWVDKFNGTSWEHVGDWASENLTTRLSLAFDADNTPHVAYYRTISNATEVTYSKLRKFDGANWVDAGAPNFPIRGTLLSFIDNTPYVAGWEIDHPANLALSVIVLKASDSDESVFDYSPNAVVGTAGTPITPLIPDVNHPELTLFTIEPDLPYGLLIDFETGHITGTPTGILPPSEFVVTATTNDIFCGQYTAKVYITINSGDGTNGENASGFGVDFEANDNELTASCVREFTGDFSVNDNNPHGDLYYESGTFATEQGGSITVNKDGTYIYTPPADYIGSDSFTYTVCNAEDDSKRGHIWFFGEHLGLDFKTEPPTPIPGHNATSLGGTVMSDVNGEPLFYSDGRFIANIERQNIVTIDAIDCNDCAPIVFVPHPGNKNQYHVFFVDRVKGSNANNSFRHFIWDVTANDGKGDAVSDVGHRVKTNRVYGGITAIKSNYEDAWWVVIRVNPRYNYADPHSGNIHKRTIHAYKITASGFNPIPVVTVPDDSETLNGHGYIRPNKTNDRVAMSNIATDIQDLTEGFGKIELYDFDSRTGKFSNMQLISKGYLDPDDVTSHRSDYGLEFSENGRYLYTTGRGPSRLRQIDLENNFSEVIIVEINPVIDGNYDGSGVNGVPRMAPNGKIYISRDESTNIDVINNPNAHGAASNFVPSAQKVNFYDDRYCRLELSYNYHGYAFGGTTTLDCKSATLHITVEECTEFTISYHANGGTGNPPADAIFYDLGQTVTVLDNTGEPPFEKAGYYFAGWNTSSDGTGDTYQPNDDFEIPGNNTVFYAIWLELITITFDTDGGTTIDPIRGKPGDGLPPITNPTKTGHTFSGWSPDIPTEFPEEDLTVVAQWIINKHTLSYNANGGEGTVPASPTEYEFEETVTVLGNTGDPALTKTGFTFGGWNTQADGLGVTYQAGDDIIMPDAAVTLYALWDELTITVSEVNHPAECGADGSIVLTFTLVPDGTYTITYDGGSFENVVVSNNEATITAPAGNYNDLQITVDDITSAPGVNATLSDPAPPTITVSEQNNPVESDGNGTIVLTFTLVPDGTYTINYDGGSFAGVLVAANTATIEAPAGAYNNLQITIAGCTSASGVNAELTDPKMPVCIEFSPNMWMPNNTVHAIAKCNDYTYIGGEFTLIEVNSGRGAKLTKTSTNPDPTFPIVNNTIHVIIPDGEGGWYIGGAFTKVGDFDRNRIARIHSNGSVCETFNPDANGTVRTIAIDGEKLYVGGEWGLTSIGGQDRNRIARLDKTTGLADDWNPDANAAVFTIAIDGDDVYVGGQFNGANSIGGQTRNRIARLNKTNGDADSEWNPNADGGVSTIATDGDYVYVGGAFSNIGGQMRNNIARLNKTNGTADAAWNPNANSTVNTIAIDGSHVYIGGLFTEVWGGWARNRIAQLNKTDGNFGSNWNPNADAAVNTITIDGDDVYVGGQFTTIGGQTRNRIARFSSGTWSTLDPTWDPNASNTVNTIAIAGDDVYVGGQFTTVGGQTRNRIARFNNSDGSLDAWNPNANGTVRTLAIDDSHVYVGGEFHGANSIGGQARNRIARLNNADGNADAWNPNANSTVNTIAVDGSFVYVAGNFNNIGGSARTAIARLDKTTGTADAWNPGPGHQVNTIALDDSHVYVGGGFTSIAATARNRIARFNKADGTLDTWNPNANSTVNTIAIDASHVYVGGAFNHASNNTIGGANRNRIARLHKTTGLADAWNPNATNTVNTIAIDEASVYVGGTFNHASNITIGGANRNRIARLNKTNGNAEPDWNPNANNTVNTIVTAGGNVYVGGQFTTIEGATQSRFAVYAACYDPDADLPTITVTSQNHPTECGANGSIVLTFTNVPAGTYTITYDGGSFSGVEVAENTATITAPAGNYNDLQITVDDNTSALGVNATLSDPPTPTIAVSEQNNPVECDGEGSIVLTFTNVPAGTYTITYDGASFAGVEVADNEATITASAGNYNNLQITITGCTSVSGVNASLTAPVCHNISFNANGGEGGEVQSVVHGVIPTPPTVTRTGYSFAGWTPDIVEATEDATYTAQWTINSYNLAYDANGGNGEVPAAPAEVEYNAEVTVLGNIGDPPLTKVGFFFGGWNTQPDGSGITYQAGDSFNMPDGAVTLYALWSTQPTITFNTDGGSTIDPVSGEPGDPLPPIPDPTKTGYTFVGWDPDLPDVFPGENMEVTAQWEINSYTLTYDANGGDGEVPAAPAEVEYNAEVTVLGNIGAPPLTKVGFLFGVWNTQADGLGETYQAGDSFNMPDGAVTLYAIWNELTVITFNTDGGSTIDPVSGEPGETLPNIPNPTKTGYTFVGWNPALPDVFPGENLEVTAQWEINSYTLAYDTNGGVGEVPAAPAEVEYDAEVTVLGNIGDPPLTKPGYYFGGWNTQPDGSGDTYQAGDNFNMPDGAVTLYAIWLCIDPTDGGTIAASQDICSGTAPAAFTSELLPSGHGGTLEYQWQKSTNSALSGFSNIAGATSVEFDENASLTQTTWYRRMARVTCDPVGWASATASNAVQVTVEPTPISGSLAKNPDEASVVMGSIVTVTLTPGEGGNGTDQLQYRTHNGTKWSNWQNYISGDPIDSHRKTEIEVRTRRLADYCLPAGIVSVSWDVEQTSVKNVNENFVYYFIQDAVDVASPGHTICIGTNIYDETVNTSSKGGLILQAGCNGDVGIVTVTGGFTLTADDELKLELSGDNDYDKFIIEGDADITGATLDIKVASGYKPAAGTRFIIFTSPNNPGKFSNPSLIKTNGHYFILSYEEDNGTWNVVLTSLVSCFKINIRGVGND